MTADAPLLCNTLEESLTLLEKDEVMVEALGAEFIEWFVSGELLNCLCPCRSVSQ